MLPLAPPGPTDVTVRRTSASDDVPYVTIRLDDAATERIAPGSSAHTTAVSERSANAPNAASISSRPPR
jgi:hypothetical protein